MMSNLQLYDQWNGDGNGKRQLMTINCKGEWLSMTEANPLLTMKYKLQDVGDCNLVLQ